MARIAILAIVTSGLLAGCLGSDPAADLSAPEPDPAPTSAETPAAPPAPAAAVPDVPPCPTDHVNNGTSVTLGDYYVLSPSGGNLAVVYVEGNGCQRLQTEEDRPSDPDTKVAELPYAMALALAAASANA